MVSQQDLASFLALLRTPALGNARARRMLARHGTAEAIFAAGQSAWAAAGCSETVCTALAQPDRSGAEADMQWLGSAANRSFITFDDPLYPPRLAEIANAPLALFALGDAALLASPQLAIVGARSASAQGRANAQTFAAELVRRGLVVTSGLALGIDAAAHRGALDAGGRTVAVCGNGLDRVYPARNRELAEAIEAHGLIVSEFAIGTPPKPEHFPRRNRIISGLSLGVLVIEAVLESGSLITARLAAEQGREVFALPGSIHNPLARGCHALIRDGAKLTETVDDIVIELAPLLPSISATASPSANPAAQVADQVQAQVLEALGFETVALDHLVARLGRPVAEIGAALLSLELQGWISAGPGDTFTRLQRL